MEKDIVKTKKFGKVSMTIGLVICVLAWVLFYFNVFDKPIQAGSLMLKSIPGHSITKFDRINDYPKYDYHKKGKLLDSVIDIRYRKALCEVTSIKDAEYAFDEIDGVKSKLDKITENDRYYVVKYMDKSFNELHFYITLLSKEKDEYDYTFEYNCDVEGKMISRKAFDSFRDMVKESLNVDLGLTYDDLNSEFNNVLEESKDKYK